MEYNRERNMSYWLRVDMNQTIFLTYYIKKCGEGGGYACHRMMEAGSVLAGDTGRE